MVSICGFLPCVNINKRWMSASYFILWWRQTQERSSSVSKHSLLTTPQDPIVFVFPETALSSACNMGTGSRGRGRHRPTWTQTDLEKPWELRNPRASWIICHGCHTWALHAAFSAQPSNWAHSKTWPHLFVWSRCSNSVLNCLLTRVRQGEAVGTDLPEQWGLHPPPAVPSRQQALTRRSEVTGMLSARGGFTAVTVEETNTSREIAPTRSTRSGLTAWGYGSSCQGKPDCRLVPVLLQAGRGENQYWFPAVWLLPVQAGNPRPWNNTAHS